MNETYSIRLPECPECHGVMQDVDFTGREIGYGHAAQIMIFTCTNRIPRANGPALRCGNEIVGTLHLLQPDEEWDED